VIIYIASVDDFTYQAQPSDPPNHAEANIFLQITHDHKAHSFSEGDRHLYQILPS